MRVVARFFPLFVLCLGRLCAETPEDAPAAILQRYLSAAAARNGVLNGASMEVEIEARLPKLHKEGKLQALRRISRFGRISYEILRFAGDGAVKSNVIARYLAAEVQAQNDSGESMAITAANYKFKYKGVAGGAHVFQVTPRYKRAGLFKGEVHIDPATMLPVQESGRLVKNPSIFLKRVDFVRRYDIRDGVNVPQRLESVIETRLVGRAELRVDFRNVVLPQVTAAARYGEGR